MTLSTYRYSLERMFGAERHRILGVCMLNPSTAESEDGGADDPTIRKLIGFAKRDGFDGLIVENVSPFRATDPKQLIKLIPHMDVFRVGENIAAIKHTALASAQFVVAWGANIGKHPALIECADNILGALSDLGVVACCFGRTKDGHPKHPLYLRGDTQIIHLETGRDAK